MNRIGITTTIPSEVLFAADYIPTDLNNMFINHSDKLKLIRQAEVHGIPNNFCSWIKGIFSVTLEEKIDKVIIVIQGDCSSTIVLMEIFKLFGIEVIPFSYPYDNNYSKLKSSIENLIDYFNTTWEAVKEEKKRLDNIRKKVHEIDRLTWQKGSVSGFENHYFTVSTSDMQGSPERFEEKVENFTYKVKIENKYNDYIKLGYIGVPPIVNNLYEFIEKNGGCVIFNEIQRQFSMPFDTDDVIEQYRLYTFPHSIYERIEDIKREIASRKIKGLIHYVQSFCHHHGESLIFNKKLDIPILMVECDSPGNIDARSKMRLESFINMLREKQK